MKQQQIVWRLASDQSPNLYKRVGDIKGRSHCVRPRTLRDRNLREQPPRQWVAAAAGWGHLLSIYSGQIPNRQQKFLVFRSEILLFNAFELRQREVNRTIAVSLLIEKRAQKNMKLELGCHCQPGKFATDCCYQ
jgi:hypothetical protein